MKSKNEKIRTISSVIFVILCIVSFLCLTNVIRVTTLYAQGKIGSLELWGSDLLAPGTENRAIIAGITGAFLIVAMMITIALVFWEISRNETPFTHKVAARIKLLAILMLVFYGLTLLISDGSSLTSRLFSLGTAISLTVCAAIFCFGLVLDYGCVIQDENYEIL